MELDVGSERLERLVEVAGAREQLGVAVEQVETSNAAVAVAADDERVQTLDRRLGFACHPGGSRSSSAGSAVGITRADADASAVAGDRLSHRPPEAVELPPVRSSSNAAAAATQRSRHQPRTEVYRMSRAATGADGSTA